jgi:hypothetical protein
MAQGRLVVVKRQVKDQVWHEAISLEQYNWEQTHEIPKNTESGASSISLSLEENPEYIRGNIS